MILVVLHLQLWHSAGALIQSELQKCFKNLYQYQ